MSEKDKLLNAFMDLNRAAKLYLLDPKGLLHKIFLSHALEILEEVEDKRSQELRRKLLEIKKNLKAGLRKEKRLRLADDILTIGLLLKKLA